MANDNSTEVSTILDEAIAIAATDDTFKAIEFLEQSGNPAEVADRYSQLLRMLYFKKKDVPLMVRFGRAGIDYALAQARIVETSDSNAARQLEGVAKTIAYNLGVNTWPGWNDEGIVIDKGSKRAGLDAARLNMRLAIELKRHDEVLANAHWLLGAQLLAADKPEAAAKSFKTAAETFRVANKSESALMADGYCGIARRLVEPTQDSGIEEMRAAIDALVELGSEDAKFFADQLKTAAKVFSTKQ